MVWETTNIVVGIIAAKVIQHQKGVKTSLMRLCEHTREFDAIAIAGCLPHNLLLNTSADQRILNGVHRKL
jgi:hypothetical protein